MIAQGAASLIAAQFDVIDGDVDVLLAQVLGENAADLAIADKANIPVSRVGRRHGHLKHAPDPALPKATRSLLWNSSLLDHFPPFVDVGFQPQREFLRG